MGELHHRVKNILASVTALANRSLHESQLLDEFRDAFATRLGMPHCSINGRLCAGALSP